MRARAVKTFGYTLGLSLFLTACLETGPSASQKGFEQRYTAARSALEAGNYTKSNRLYPRLLENAGPLEPRLRLEYAHSLLRAGEYASASNQSRILMDTQQGEARAAALSVYGTARHELGLQALQNGDVQTAKAHLAAAEAALAEMLKSHPDFDPLGAMTARRDSIRQRLKNIG